jgi:hypothetical protein
VLLRVDVARHGVEQRLKLLDRVPHLVILDDLRSLISERILAGEPAALVSGIEDALQRRGVVVARPVRYLEPAEEVGSDRAGDVGQRHVADFVDERSHA